MSTQRVALRLHLAHFGLTAKDRKRIERALCILADYQGPLELALRETGEPSGSAHAVVCRALRVLVDGKSGELY